MATGGAYQASVSLPSLPLFLQLARGLHLLLPLRVVVLPALQYMSMLTAAVITRLPP